MYRSRMKNFGVGFLAIAVSLGPWVRVAGGSVSQESDIARMDGKALITMVAARETEASNHRGRYMYLSVERSERRAERCREQRCSGA